MLFSNYFHATPKWSLWYGECFCLSCSLTINHHVQKKLKGENQTFDFCSSPYLSPRIHVHTSWYFVNYIFASNFFFWNASSVHFNPLHFCIAGVSPQQLIEGLRKCMSASPEFAHPCMELLLDKSASTIDDTKVRAALLLRYILCIVLIPILYVWIGGIPYYNCTLYRSIWLLPRPTVLEVGNYKSLF